MYASRLIARFARTSLQEAIAYRANFAINLLHSTLNLAAGVLGVWVLFGQVERIQGWSFAATLALLGVYLVAGALRSLFLGPSMDALAGLGGEVWTGQFDYTLLRPVNAQFLATFRRWQPFALFDLLLALGVLGTAVTQLGQALSLARLLAFLVALGAGMAIVYALLLACTALIFWSPGVLATWILDGLFQLARYPLGLYPGWLRLVLTWIVPVGIVTTVPAQALAGDLAPLELTGAVLLAVALTLAASALFQQGIRRYASASS